jgi:ankyrin repeat protein
LHLAATNNNIAMVEALIKAGANVNAEDKIGTALHRCATGTFTTLLLYRNCSKGSGDSDGVDGITSNKGGYDEERVK